MRLPKGERTPMLDQFMSIKSRYPDAILFYRMGDFYELFYDDAKIASEVLGLRLTSRAHGKAAKVPLAGFPYHQLDNYLTKMAKSRRTVVIVEQVEDPKLAKGLVKRDVVRIVTAGTNPAAIERNEPGAIRIAAIIHIKDKWGYAWADVGTGEFSAGEFTDSEVRIISGQTQPVELVYPESNMDTGPPSDKNQQPPIFSKLEDWVWEPAFARQTLLDHFSTIGLKGFGIDHLDLAVCAAGALLHYLKGNLKCDPHHLTSLSRADVAGRLFMESATMRNLELVESLTGNPQGTLFAIVDRTLTLPGKRLLYSRLLQPLTTRSLIEERLEAVEDLISNEAICTKIRSLLRGTADVQKALARLSTGRGCARDLVGLGGTLHLLPDFTTILKDASSRLLQGLSGRLNPISELNSLIQNAFVESPPLSINDGKMVKEGFDEKVDELRLIQNDGKAWLRDYEKSERQRTDIPKLKLGYNRVFGYYIEVSKIHTSKVPSDYIGRQTLVSAERYTTSKLQEYQEKLVTADDKICELEKEIFLRVADQVLEKSLEIQENAHALAELDFLSGLAVLAVEEGYNKPHLDDSDRISLHKCRHPVVEKLMIPGQQFVSNDVDIGGDGARIMILTGPNMAGKSTYLRQTALVVILAQMGSFVPVADAKIGIVDKLFTRIGALDNLAGGESTFLVEMQETASILNNATSKSLVLIDEVGRGTSTFDGLSLAWSIVEYLHEKKNLQPRTLFATHYHELVELEKYLSRVINYNVAAREYGDQVVFLHKIVPGGSDRSFGIHVAQMAGLPEEVISRAREVLETLEENDLNPGSRNTHDGQKDDESEAVKGTSNKNRKRRGGKFPDRRVVQLSLFDPVENALRNKLKQIDPDQITPMEALSIISELKNIVNRGKDKYTA